MVRSLCSKSEASKHHGEFWLLQNCITLSTGPVHFNPPVRQIDISEKIDGPNIFEVFTLISRYGDGY